MNKNIDLDEYFVLNTLGISISEFLWGIGIPVILESTFVTVFLTYIGATNFQIGLPGFIFTIAMAVTPFFVAYITANMRYKKPATIISQFIPSISVILLGFTFFIFNNKQYNYGIFLFYYTLFAIGLASTVPIWQNYITKIFVPKKALKGISVMMVAQNVGKIFGSFLISFFIVKYGVNILSSAALFMITGFLFLIGSLCFVFTKEVPDLIEEEKKGFFKYYLKYFKDIFKNKNILLYILQDIEFNIIIVFITFYAKYAIEVAKISESMVSGIFILFIFSGSIIASIVLGFLDKFGLKTRYLFIKVSSVLAILFLIFSKNIYAFYISSFFAGFSRSGRMQLYILVVKDLSGLSDASPYYAVLPFIMMPVVSLLPLLAGVFLDKFNYAYQELFVVMLFIVILTFVPFLKIKFKEIY